MRAEILIDPEAADRGRAMIEAMVAAAPIPIKQRHAYRGDCEILVTYGTGHPERRIGWLAHLRKGGRCIGLDLGYWNRTGRDAAMRVTLDADHCNRWIRPEDPERFDREGIRLREDHDPKGPIIVVGTTKKDGVISGAKPMEWELAKFAQLATAYPKREIVYRPKRARDQRPHGYRFDLREDIRQVIKGASLVVCKHSNVAVDACIAGIPVACDDGAASALYTGDLCNPTKPTKAQRLEFLRSLAHWQYRPSEAAQCWDYLLGRIRFG